MTYGNLVFIAGKGSTRAGDITVHTKSVLNQLEAELKKAGSSMDKVLKVNVYLHDLKDYDGMNAVFRGRFGPIRRCARPSPPTAASQGTRSWRSTASRHAKLPPQRHATGAPRRSRAGPRSPRERRRWGAGEAKPRSV